MAAQVRQLGNIYNAGVPAMPTPIINEDAPAPGVTIEGDAPARRLNGGVLRNMGQKYRSLFDRFASERIPAEQKWIKNLRQYLGIYDPDIERLLPRNKSRAYPRITRMKCIAMLSRLMNLMFPGNEDNWELKSSPSPEMSPESVAKAVGDFMAAMKEDGQDPILTQEFIDEAVRALATKNAEAITALIKDQLAELGGDQTVDWIALNRKVVDSGIKYGIGVLEGPFVRKIQESGWMLAAPADPTNPTLPPQFQPVTREIYKPQYDFLPVWDFYPDMSARELPGDGYFKRKIMGRSKLNALAKRPDFFESQIKEFLTQYPGGNYKPKSWENELRTMGLSGHAENVSTQSTGREKYEIIIWHGPVSAATLREAGATVPDNMITEDVEAELWMVENWIIKAEINAWRRMGVTMPQVHVFSFDEDDTSPIGQGLPGIMRDSQLSVCAATRMALDNASITCGPNLEINTTLLRPDQDLSEVVGYKIWYRDDDGQTSQFPAVREIKFDGHLNELQGLTKMFLDFGEMETFIGPSTGGDFQKMPSEPMRTAAGASMLRGDAALPFKDIVRNYDRFTQSVIWSQVQFNKKYNPDIAPEGDYDVIPRGATSLIAKEVRGMQLDQLSQTLTPDDMDHIDDRKWIEAKFAARDMQGMLVSEDVAKRRKSARAEQAQVQQQKADQLHEAEVRNISSDSYKNIAQGQTNMAKADSVAVKAATDMITAGEDPNDNKGKGGGAGRKAA